MVVFRGNSLFHYFSVHPLANVISVAGAVLGGYFTLIGFFVIKSKLKGKTPEAAPVPVAATVASSGDDLIPALDSPDFEAFVNSETRLSKFVGSEETLMKWVDTLGK